MQKRLTPAAIAQSAYFDPDWYRAQYADVDLLQADPLQHFLTWGRLLERSPGPGFDAKFYLSRYGDVGDANPLQHYLELPRQDHRPVSPGQLRQRLTRLEQKMQARWQPEPLRSARAVAPVISYCIPLMGRLGDIQGTLADNLAEHAGLVGQVEFLIVLFGDAAETEAWIRSTFAGELASGLLRLVLDDTLDSWHFGKAKNAFRPHLLGQIYSSLDGDNFVTATETQRLLDLHRDYDGHFLLHHFSGQWGDGTSGRVSLPAAVYRATGYDDRLLPRQFDEIDMVLRALQGFPAMPFLCLDETRNLFTLAGFAQRFRTEEGLPNRITVIGDIARRPPLNPRGADYAQRMPYLNHMGNLNAGLSGFASSSDPQRAGTYLNQLEPEKHKLLDTLPRERLLEMFFLPARRRDAEHRVAEGQICAFMVIKNEPHFLPALIRHYRQAGVTDFFIIDDGSDQPVETLLPDPDVHVFRPKVGSFRTLKTAWIEALMNWFLPEGAWALTIDADEFIQLPKGCGSFGALARDLESGGHDYMPGLMIDLLPAPGTPGESLHTAERDFLRLFTHAGNFSVPVSEDYLRHPSIAWAFGPDAGLAWRVDIRNHAFGTFDSLRKIPFLRWRPGRHLNQGFHTLHPTDGSAAPGHEMWSRRPILPVHHYKLVRLYSDQARAQMLREAGNYHARTGENLTRIFGGTGAESLARLRRLEPSLVPVGQIHDLLE